MKGVALALETMIMTGILFGVFGSIYFWGVPLIQKNKDIYTLQASESFMSELAGKIITLSKSPGRESITIPVPELNFDGATFKLTVDTDGTIYSTEGLIPLGMNDCAPDEGIWGVHDYYTLCVVSNKVGDKFETTYTLKFIQLDTEGVDSRKIVLSGRPNIGGEKRVITLGSAGTTADTIGTRKVLKSNIAVEIGV